MKLTAFSQWTSDGRASGLGTIRSSREVVPAHAADNVRSHSKREIFRSDSRIDWPTVQVRPCRLRVACSLVGRLHSSAISEFLRRDGGRRVTTMQSEPS